MVNGLKGDSISNSGMGILCLKRLRRWRDKSYLQALRTPYFELLLRVAQLQLITMLT